MMRSFRQMVAEMPELGGLNKKHEDDRLGKPPSPVTVLSKHPSGLVIATNQRHDAFFAMDPKTREIELELDCDGSATDKYIRVYMISAAGNNRIPAVEFYRHLIMNLGYTIASSTTQTGGGAKVWRDLSHYAGIEIKHVGGTYDPTDWFSMYGNSLTWFEASKRKYRGRR